MRNLKRALSLALASVMLLGMMVVGSSAAFTDQASIDNTEAVDLISGLEVMVGYEDGSFGPDKTVTRAEAAVIIAKILHGANINPANFAGTGKFTDVPAWAEGWVNLVASLGIIKGYGDGKFGPNDQVTTVQFATMLLKTLGYFVGEDEKTLGIDWEMVITSKATAVGLYGDLVLDKDAGLTRENVAEMTMNALWAQRVAYDDWRGLYVKSNDRNVVVTNGTDDVMNTLAQNTFGLYVVEGVVVANGVTDEALSASLKSDAQTRVEFKAETDLNQDGKAEFSEDETYDFEYETGLDMIGHAVKVYYTIEKKSPVVFTITDQATLVATIGYNSNTTKLAEAANNAGFKKNSILDIEKEKYIVNYDMDIENAAPNAIASLDDLIVISNSANMEVDYVIALDQTLNVVENIDVDKNDVVDYTLKYNNIGSIVATAEVEEDDFVIVTNIGNQNDVLVIEPAVLVDGDLTKIIGKSTTSATVNKIVVDGETYSKSNVDATLVNTNDVNFTLFNAIDTIGSVTMVMDGTGKVMGLTEEPGVPNYAYVARYGWNTTHDSWTDGVAYKALVYFADGTSGTYTIDTGKSDVPVGETGWEHDTALRGDGYDTLNGDPDLANDGLRGIHNVKVLSNGKIDIDPILPEVTNTNIKAADIKLIKNHATLLDAGNNNVTENDGSNTYTLLNNNDTVYFYVTGSYSDDAGDQNTLKVDVITGIKNVVKATNKVGTDDYTILDDTTYGTGIREAFYTGISDGKRVSTRAEIDTMLIQGVIVEDDEVYYYNEGNYEVDKAEGGYVVTYTLYDIETGEAVTVTYDNNGKYFSTVDAAKDHASDDGASIPNGFYTIGAYELKKVADDTSTTGLLDKTYYVVDDTALYDDYNDNLFTADFGIGSITDDVIVVDVCNSGLTSVAKIAAAVKGTKDGVHSDVTLSYAVDKNLDTDVVFVTSYKPDKTDAPNGTVSTATYELTASYDAANTKIDVIVKKDNVNVASATNVTANVQLVMTLSSGAEKTFTFTVKNLTISGGAVSIDLPGFNGIALGGYGEFDITLNFVNGTDKVVVSGDCMGI